MNMLQSCCPAAKNKRFLPLCPPAKQQRPNVVDRNTFVLNDPNETFFFFLWGGGRFSISCPIPQPRNMLHVFCHNLFQGSLNVSFKSMIFSIEKNISPIPPNCSKDCSCEFMMSLCSMNGPFSAGVTPANTSWGRGDMYGECTWTSSSGLPCGRQPVGRHNGGTREGYYTSTLLQGLISTSTLLDRKPASTPTVFLSFSHPQLQDLLTFFNSFFLVITLIVENFHNFCFFLPGVSCTYDNIQFPQPLLGSTL